MSVLQIVAFEEIKIAGMRFKVGIYIQHLGTQLPIFVQLLLILHFPFCYIYSRFSCLAFLSTAVDRKVESLVEKITRIKVHFLHPEP